ncbi:MAG: hypothetical protein WCP21_04405 [Armatimonadota bacterium]
MKAPLLVVDEREKQIECLPHKRRNIRDFQAGWAALNCVAATIGTYFCPDAEWDFFVAAADDPKKGKGSLTFRHKVYKDRIVKVFIDDDNRLAAQYGLTFPSDSIVVGATLGDFPPYERFLIRHDLRSRFPFYMDPIDPLAPLPKTKLLPKSYQLDIVFLPPGPCRLAVANETLQATWKKIREGADLPSDAPCPNTGADYAPWQPSPQPVASEE